MKIAIVDDLSSDRELLCERLAVEIEQRALSAEIEQFESGESFLAEFEAGKFAVAFLDIYMDGINGVEVARRIYSEDPKCRIIFLTTSEEYSRKHEGEGIGVVSITKMAQKLGGGVDFMSDDGVFSVLMDVPVSRKAASPVTTE